MRRRPAAGGRSTVLAAVASPIVTNRGRVADVVPMASATAKPIAVAPRAKSAAAAVAVPKPSALAVAVRRQLTPAALRQQIVLSEILRPPVALRALDHGPGGRPIDPHGRMQG